jgi:hypothetical protein
MKRYGSLAAFAAALAALAGVALASSQPTTAGDGSPSAAPAAARPGGLLRLDGRGKVPVTVLPKVRSSRNADRLAGRRARAYRDRCSAESVDLGSWCLLASPYPLTGEEIGKNNYFWASATCAELGGYLPTAAQLIGAAARVKLASTIDDNPVDASIDEDPTDGLKDRREMSATLITTASGSRAAGSQGVTEGSLGDPRAGEPNPVPQPANPSPETLQYVTVYDNRNQGGFAGGKPVGQPELFRCAFNKSQGGGEELG